MFCVEVIHPQRALFTIIIHTLYCFVHEVISSQKLILISPEITSSSLIVGKGGDAFGSSF